MNQPDPGDWGTRLTAVAASQIRYWRTERGLSAQQLADECLRLGFNVPRNTVANLENGRRTAVAVAEILVMARALKVPPILLLTGGGRAEAVEIVPGQTVPTSVAVRWTGGHDAELSPDRDSMVADDLELLVLDLERHETLVGHLRRRLRQLAAEPGVRKHWETVYQAFEPLLDCRLGIERLAGGGMVAPALPTDLQWVGSFKRRPERPDPRREPLGFRPGEPAAWETDDAS